MRKILSILCAAMIGASTVAVTSGSASADPMRFNSGRHLGASHGGHHWRHRGHHGWHGHHGRHGYYHGYRGYRYHRHGYRYHGGFWYPAAAFLGAAIIGNAIANAPSGDAHVRSCYARYKSYRASDNTYQPYNGPRRQCR